MSRDASITLDWGDGSHVFRLGYGELIQLQEGLDAGPAWVLHRLMMPNSDNLGWRVQDLREVIRLGLIGGGMDPLKALGLVRTYVEQRPPMESIDHARAVLSAALVGAPDEDKPSQKKSRPKSRRSRAGSGISPMPSAPAQP